MHRFKLLLLIICALGLQTVYAQDYFGRKSMSKKAAIAENGLLRARLDSLQTLVDSLQAIATDAESELIALLDGNAPAESIETGYEYTPEVTDSLLHLWYRNSFSGNFNVFEEYDMDSLRFSSDVSEEEMIRRLEAMNSFISLPYNSVVKNYIVLYSERMNSRMGRVMGLSEYYFPMFEEAFARYGLPDELKYMAVVESMLNPVALSRAGARGMWQFMYNTAKTYGLEINSYVDERLDVEKSVDAAARYLRDSYTIFGDWALAISSYNCGAGNVSKAIRRAGGKRDFWSIYPYLPRETRGYVPAFVGAMYAMTYWKEYGIVPQEVGMPAMVDTFVIKRNLHFEQISSVVGVPLEDIRNLNPQYLHDIVPGNSHDYILKLPYSWTSAFVDTPMETLYAYKADSLMSSRVQREVANAVKNDGRIAYKVRSGDYLGKIASRYGVTVNQLKSWNNLRSSNIRVGQTLYIYGATKVPAASSASSSTASSSSASSASSTQVASNAGSQQFSGEVYTVKSGDSLYTIAKNYPGVSAQNIRTFNGLTSDRIRPGQKLRIPTP